MGNIQVTSSKRPKIQFYHQNWSYDGNTGPICDLNTSVIKYCLLEKLGKYFFTRYLATGRIFKVNHTDWVDKKVCI